MSTHHIDDLRETPAFKKAYDQLDQRRRLAVDHALHKASRAMDLFVRRCEPVLWADLKPDDAHAFDTTVRTQLALGVYRATFANAFTRDFLPITDAVDEAVRATDIRAARLALGRFARQSALLADVDPAQSAAFHQVLDRMTRAHGLPVMRLAAVVTDAAMAADVAIDALSEDSASLVAQLSALREGAGDEMQRHAQEKGIPAVEAGALWVLAMRERCSVFGNEERTQMYSDYDEPVYTGSEDGSAAEEISGDAEFL